MRIRKFVRLVGKKFVGPRHMGFRGKEFEGF